MDTVHRDSQGDNSQAGPTLRQTWERVTENFSAAFQFQHLLTCITIALLVGIVYSDSVLVESFLLLCFSVNLLLHFYHQQLAMETFEEIRKSDFSYFARLLRSEKNALAAVRTDVADTVKMFKLIERRHYSRLSPKKRTKALQ